VGGRRVRGRGLLTAQQNSTAARRIRVGLLLFEAVDLLDVGGPYEVLLTADRLRERAGQPPLFDVITVSPDGGPVTSYGGLVLTPRCGSADAPRLDLLIVPGAVDIERVVRDPAVIEAVRRLRPAGGLLASVCTGAFVLADAGFLEDRRATTHHEDVPALAGLGVEAVTRRWVDAGDVVTAGGLSSGIAMALHLVERVSDRALAVAVAEQIEYPWDPDDGLVV
jgi:transcriptional regulator GlxA family with amidase domain